MASYPIYKWHKAGRDEWVADQDSWCAAAALEEFAKSMRLEDYSLDGDRLRVFLCPPFGRPAFFYTYTEDVSAVREP